MSLRWTLGAHLLIGVNGQTAALRSYFVAASYVPRVSTRECERDVFASGWLALWNNVVVLERMNIKKVAKQE